MWLVSELGNSRVYRAAAIAIVFGIQLRSGLLLLNLLLSSYLLSGVLKQVFAMPRPLALDSRIQELAGITLSRPYCPGPDAPSFWSPLSPEVLARCRALPQFSLGFPSGHLTGATSFFGGAALLLRHRWLALLCMGVVPLMGLSRMYLGVHFVGDAIGGVIVGAIGIGGVAGLRRWPKLAAAVLLGFALIALLAEPSQALAVGRLAGAVGSTLFLVRRGLPPEGGTIGVRAARVALAFGLYFGSAQLVWLAGVNGGFGPSRWRDLVSGALPISVCLLGTVWLGLQLRLFGPSLTSPAAALP